MKFNNELEKYVVIWSDSFVFPMNEIAKIKIMDNGSLAISLRWIFEKKDELGYKTEKDVDGKTVTFRCINYNAVGTGLFKPVEIATNGRKKWFILFWCTLLSNDGPRRIEYSILESKEDIQ